MPTQTAAVEREKRAAPAARRQTARRHEPNARGGGEENLPVGGDASERHERECASGRSGGGFVDDGPAKELVGERARQLERRSFRRVVVASAVTEAREFDGGAGDPVVRVATAAAPDALRGEESGRRASFLVGSNGAAEVGAAPERPRERPRHPSDERGGRLYLRVYLWVYLWVHSGGFRG